MATEAHIQGQYADADPPPPWLTLDCSTCVSQSIRGCHEDRPGEYSAITDSGIKLRRCKRAFLNPDTDLYDADLADTIAMVRDMEALRIPYTAGGLADQPAWVVDAARIVRGVTTQMERKFMESRRQK